MELTELEPWCSTIYSDANIDEYIKMEQPNTLYNLSERVKSLDAEKNNDILVSFDGSKVTDQNFEIVMKLPHIISDSGNIGTAELDIFIINILSMNTYERELLKCKK